MIAIVLLFFHLICGDDLIPFGLQNIQNGDFVLTNNINQVANCWTANSYPIPTGFSASFEIGAVDNNGNPRADGYSFYLSTTPNRTGVSGGGLSRLSNSAGFSLNYFANQLQFFNALYSNIKTENGIPFDNFWHTIDVNFDCNTLSVSISGGNTFTYTGNQIFTCSYTQYYFGVGAATGGQWQYHWLKPTITVNAFPPVTSGRLTTSRVTSSPLTSSRVTSSPLTSNGVTTSSLTSSPITSNLLTSLQITSSPITSSYVTSSPNSQITFSDLSGTSNEQLESSSKSKITPIIIGVILGLLVLLGIGILLIIIVNRRLIKSNRESGEQELQNMRMDTSTSGSIFTGSMNPNNQKEYFKNYTIPYNKISFGAKIGEGSFGEVYVYEFSVEFYIYYVSGKYRKTDVAIKKLKKMSDELINEAIVLRQLPAHPNVVLFRGVTLPPDPVCVVTEFCSGGSLHNFLKKNKRKLSEDQILMIACDVARGMIHLHEGVEGLEIIHRDLAARNILMKKDGTCAVSDFGLARTKTLENDEGSTQTSLGPIKWMAPESLEKHSYSKKSDIFSFGVVLYEIVTQEEPWSGENIVGVIKKVTSGGRMKIPVETPQYLADIMIACWNQDPSKRPTFEEIIVKLEAKAESIKLELRTERVSQKDIYNVKPHTTYYQGSNYHLNVEYNNDKK